MTQWFHERYISRVEHQQVIAYYKKLVGQLQGKIRELRTEAAPTAADGADCGSAHGEASPAARSLDTTGPRTNVIAYDFRRRKGSEAR